MLIGLQTTDERAFPIEGCRTRIGRASSCDVVLDDPTVAPLHAEILITNVGIELHHRAEALPTLLNDQPVIRAFLAGGDLITVGGQAMEFILGGETSALTRRRLTRAKLEPGRLMSELSAVEAIGASPALKGARPTAAEAAATGEAEDLIPLGVIARGRHGKILKLRQNGHIIAGKELDLERMGMSFEDLQAEVAELARFRHPSLVRLFELVRHGGRALVLMELIEGPSLAQRLERRPAPPLERLLDYAIALAEGLVYLAAQGYVHRDIKPQNVILEPRHSEDGATEQARLVDFGLAVMRRDREAAGFAGTPAYMSPEQIRSAELTERSDLFSFAVTFYEALVGRRPFLGNSPIELFSAILEDDPNLAPVEARHAELGPLFRALLAKAPEDRPDAAETLERLRRVRAELD